MEKCVTSTSFSSCSIRKYSHSFIDAEYPAPLQNITNPQWTSRVLNITSSIDDNFDSNGNAKWCCFSKVVLWSDDKMEYQCALSGCMARKKDASACLPAFLDANIEYWMSAWGTSSWSSIESAPWGDTQYLGCKGRYCWRSRLMLLLLLYSHRVLSREKKYDFLRPTSFWRSRAGSWYTCVEPTVVGGVGTHVLSPFFLKWALRACTEWYVPHVVCVSEFQKQNHRKRFMNFLTP